MGFTEWKRRKLGLFDGYALPDCAMAQLLETAATLPEPEQSALLARVDWECPASHASRWTQDGQDCARLEHIHPVSVLMRLRNAKLASKVLRDEFFARPKTSFQGSGLGCNGPLEIALCESFGLGLPDFARRFAAMLRDTEPLSFFWSSGRPGELGAAARAMAFGSPGPACGELLDIAFLAMQNCPAAKTLIYGADRPKPPKGLTPAEARAWRKCSKASQLKTFQKTFFTRMLPLAASCGNADMALALLRRGAAPGEAALEACLAQYSFDLFFELAQKYTPEGAQFAQSACARQSTRDGLAPGAAVASRICGDIETALRNRAWTGNECFEHACYQEILPELGAFCARLLLNPPQDPTFAPNAAAGLAWRFPELGSAFGQALETACPSPPAAEIARLVFDSALSSEFPCPRLARRMKAAQARWNGKDRADFAELMHKALSESLSQGRDRPGSPIPPLDKGQAALLLARLQTVSGGRILPPEQSAEQIAARFGIACEYLAAFAAAECNAIAGNSAPAPKTPKPRI